MWKGIKMSTIHIYADGACFPNPGEMAVGIVLEHKGRVKEISQKIGQGTNNRAELMAIKIGLEAIKDRSIPVKVLSDSQYALMTITGKWSRAKNQELIDSIEELAKNFFSVSYQWIRGHSGDMFQERADSLANQFFEKGCDL